MFQKFILIIMISLLTGCAGFGSKINNFEQRSIVYGWVNIDEVDGNELISVMMKQYMPRTDKPYYHLGFEEMDGGYLFYHYGMENGSYKADNIRAQSCIAILCGNTIYQYDFGSQGSDTSIIIKEPGVYYLGGFELVEQETGFFEQGKFNIQPTEVIPPMSAIYDILIKNKPEGHPIITERLQNHFK